MFWVTVLDAFYQSLVCFFLPYFVSFIFSPKDTFRLPVFKSSIHPSIYLSEQNGIECLYLSALGKVVSVGVGWSSADLSMVPAASVQ